MTALTPGQIGVDPRTKHVSMVKSESFVGCFISMLTSQILQSLGGDAASASNWEPQAVQIALSLSGILIALGRSNSVQS